MLGTVIGIIGIIVGLASVVLAAVFEWRRKKYPKRMSFYILDAVRLTSAIVDELKNVTLVYDDKPITKTVSYLKTLFAEKIKKHSYPKKYNFTYALKANYYSEVVLTALKDVDMLEKTLSNGAIIGIIIGSGAFLALLAIGICYIIFKKKSL